MLIRQQRARTILATAGAALSCVALIHCGSSDNGSSSAGAGTGGTAHGGSSGSFAVAGKGGAGGASAGATGIPGGASGSAGTAGASNGCTTDTSCGTGKICDAGLCQVAQCAMNDDCGASQICDKQRCVTQTCTPPAVTLSYAAPAATLAVGLIGSFNGWGTGAATAAPWLLTQGVNNWSGSFMLSTGANVYKFFVETATACTLDADAGASGSCDPSQACLQGHCWGYVSDPANPHTASDGFGGLNAIIDMSCTGAIPYVPPVMGEAGASSDGGAAGAH